MKITEESLKQQEAAQNQASSGQPDHLDDEKPQSEREKLRSMSKKDRLWYIWAYYKFHIIGFFIAIVVLWSIGTAMYQKSFDTVLYCMYLNNRSEEELNTAPLEQGFAGYLGLGEKELITTESTFISYGDDTSEFGYASMAKLTALVAAKELDIIIGDHENLDHYASMDGMLDLETELPEDVLALVGDRLIFTTGSDGAEHAYGISLEGTWFAEESHLAQDPPIFSIISNTTHKDSAIALLHYIFDQTPQSPAS